MTCHLRYEQCCSELGCLRPARHAELCVMHYMAACAAVRSLCDLLDRIDAAVLRGHLETLTDALQPTEPVDSIAIAECAQLEALMYDVPAYERRAA